VRFGGAGAGGSCRGGKQPGPRRREEGWGGGSPRQRSEGRLKATETPGRSRAGGGRAGSSAGGRGATARSQREAAGGPHLRLASDTAPALCARPCRCSAAVGDNG